MSGYMGAKSGAGVYQTIVALMPPHDTYIEPFAGSAAVFAAKATARRSVLIERDAKQAAVLRSVAALFEPPPEVLRGDALPWLRTFAPTDRTLIYADPPYLLSTRSSAKRYAHELTEADHQALAAALTRLGERGVAVILSGYPSPLYDALYVGWNTREFQAMTRGGVRTEKLWFNFEPGVAHFATFAGRDFTDRQRIKRKAARWAAAFGKLKAAERQAVLAAILAAGDRS